MKKVFYAIFGLAALLCLQVSCKNFDPVRISVQLRVSENGTAILDKSSVPIGTVVTLQCTPDEGFNTSVTVDCGDVYLKNCFQDEADKNKYYIIVDDDEICINVNFERKTVSKIITTETSHNYYNVQGSVTVTPEYAYGGQTVDVYFSPNAGYKVTDVKIIMDSEITVKYTIDQNDKNHYFFIMPEIPVYNWNSDTQITYSFIPDLELTAEKNTFLLNEPIVLNAGGTIKNKLYDLYLHYADYYEPLALDADLSGGTLDISGIKIGNYSICLCEDKSASSPKYIELLDLKIIPEDLMDGWDVTCCRISSVRETYYGELAVSLKTDENVIVRSYYESNPDDIKETYIWRTEEVFYFDYMYEKPSDAVIFQVYDTNKKLISNKVRYEIPVAPETPLNTGKENVSYSSLGINLDDFANYTITVSEEDSQYFDVVKEDSIGYLWITPKKTTDISRSIIVKNPDGEVYATISFKIKYAYASLEFEITR